MGSVAFVDIPSVDCGIVPYHRNIHITGAACQSFVVAVSHAHSPFGMPGDAALNTLLPVFSICAIFSVCTIISVFPVFSL